MNNPFTQFVSWTVQKGALDHWTSYHIAAGLFIAKVAQWLGASDLWAVLWVLIIGIFVISHMDIPLLWNNTTYETR